MSGRDWIAVLVGSNATLALVNGANGMWWGVVPNIAAVVLGVALLRRHAKSERMLP